MSIIIFLLVLGLLIFVHEFGHFITAKKSGVKVHEFALGFPPTIAETKINGTVYKLNLLPLGGYVNLEGENGEPEETKEQANKKKSEVSAGDSFSSKGPFTKTLILVAGVTMNIILAWVLFSICFMIGYPTDSSGISPRYIKSEDTLILETIPDSPAAEAGLLAGDILYEASDKESSQTINSAEDIGDFIQNSEYDSVEVTVIRKGENQTFLVNTTTDLELHAEEDNENRKMIGISTQDVAIVQYPPHLALVHGAEWTYNATVSTVIGIYNLILDAFRGQADMSGVAGPIGIVNLVGEAYAVGIIYLLSFTAIISINLAVINLIPIPALDGGRILFTWIEVLRGSPISTKTQMIANGIGFALLILLMIFISIKDIVNLF